MKLCVEIEVPDHYSDETRIQTSKFAKVLKEAGELFAAKQESYGRGNIAKRGERGVAIRLTDKTERLDQLLNNGGQNDLESVADTWIDVLNYGGIGLMCHRGEW